jgi:hypothetical protein
VVLEPSTFAECKGKARPLFEETLVSMRRNQKQQPKETAVKDQQVEPSFKGPLQRSADTAGGFQLFNIVAGQYNFDVRFFARYWYLRSLTVPVAKDAPIDLARNWLTLKAGDRVSGVKVTLSEGASSISGHVELPEERRPGQILVYVVPAGKAPADDVLRHFAVPVADDGSFSLDQVPPGRYWTIAKLVTADKETNTATLRLPGLAEARVRLRREAEDAKSEIDLKPCQILRNHTLPLASN